MPVGPGPDHPLRHVAWQLTSQAASCSAMGSPLSAHLLTVAAGEVLAEGPLAALLTADVRPGRGDAAALRFLAALHRLVLERRAPALALHYPTVGGTPDLRTVGDAMRRVVAARADELRPLLELPCQTNEVGRSCGLLVGHLEVAAATGLPLRVLEVGASGGLNLRFDRYRYRVPDGDGGHRWLGPDDAQVAFADHLTTPLPGAPTALPEVVERAGCDLRPLDVTTPEGRLRASSSVWADQTDRFARLGGAIRTAAVVPAVVERASAAGWVAARLAEPVPGVATVVAHSVVEEYLPADERAALHRAVEEAGARATATAPVAHVRMEPSDRVRAAAVDVRIWPQAPGRRLLATCGAHGTDVAAHRG